MRNKHVTLLDIGLDKDFDASMVFVQAVLQNINASFPDPVVDIDFVRSRDPGTLASAFTAPCDVLHVMGHGDHSVAPGFANSDGNVTISLDELGERASYLGRGISASVVLADGCKTGIGVWQRAIRDCLQGPVTYIGTKTNVGWHEGTVFCSAFYGSFLRNKGKGRTVAEQADDAAKRAIEAYKVLVGKECPYTRMALQPSTRARHSYAVGC